MPDATLRDGSVVTDPRLGRLPSFDERSRAYRIRPLLDAYAEARGAPLGPRSHVWPPNKGLNQGQLGGCVGWSGTHRLRGDPVYRSDLDDKYAKELYFACQRRDEYDGGEYPGAKPQSGGTSVLALGQELVERGVITEYRWMGAGSQRVMDDTVETLGWVGSVLLGIDWPESCFTPRPSGLLEVDVSNIAGGHAIWALCVWLGALLPGEGRKPRDVIALQQSWGTWGVAAYGQPTGMCFIDVTDLEVLLERGGEGMLMSEKPLHASVCPTCGQVWP